MHCRRRGGNRRLAGGYAIRPYEQHFFPLPSSLFPIPYSLSRRPYGVRCGSRRRGGVTACTARDSGPRTHNLAGFSRKSFKAPWNCPKIQHYPRYFVVTISARGGVYGANSTFV